MSKNEENLIGKQKSNKKVLLKNEKSAKVNKPLTIIISAIIILSVAGITVGLWLDSESNYVAKIGTEKISKTTYNFYLNNFARQAESSNNMMEAAAAEKKKYWESAMGNEIAQDYAKKQALETSANLVLQLSKARPLFSMTNEDKTSVESYISNLISSIGTEEATDNKMKEYYGISLADYRKIYSDQLLAQKYADKIKDDMKISEKEIKEYFQKNRETLKKVTVSHILISTAGADGKPLSDSVVKAAKKKADKIYAQLKAGADFVKMAKKYNEDPGSKDTNGQYTFGKNEMSAEFDAWSFDPKRKPGDLGLVKTSYGYHVMLFEKVASYTEAKSSAKEALQNEKYSKQIDAWRKDKAYALVKNQKVYDEMKIYID